jgi:hypothetical protein
MKKNFKVFSYSYLITLPIYFFEDEISIMIFNFKNQDKNKDYTIDKNTENY